MPENSSRKVLHLPRELKADHAEHLAAALLASGGLFVEKHITERVARREVTEIDAFGTAWKDGRSFRVLIEAKSGDWETRDVFAVLGKKLYLNADLAVILHTSKEVPENRQALLSCLKDKGHSVVVMDSSAALNPQSVADVCGEPETAVRKRMTEVHSIQAWRYAFWTEKALLSALIRETKSLGKRVLTLCTARDLLNTLNECFFLADCLDQARHLYGFYSEHPRITAQMIEERRQKAPTDRLRRKSSSEAFVACVYGGEIPGVQATMYLEHRARCLLLKAAVDWIMKSAADSRPGFTVKELLVPESFRAFTDQVAREPDHVRLPQLWQAYVFGWGGFIVTSQAEAEYEHIGLEVGLPPVRVWEGLKAFDRLFPRGDGGWHYDQDGATGMSLLKMVPNAFRGLGVQRRRWIYGDSAFRGQLPPLGFKDCKRWAECGYALLQSAT